MKKLLFFNAFMLIALLGFSQTSKTIVADDVSRTIALDVDSKATINFSASEWAEMGGSASLAAPTGICIVIAKKADGCRGGLGFKCGIFSCEPTPLPPSHPSGRQQTAVATMDRSGNVTLKFDGEIDWDYLRDN